MNSVGRSCGWHAFTRHKSGGKIWEMRIYRKKNNNNNINLFLFWKWFERELEVKLNTNFLMMLYHKHNKMQPLHSLLVKRLQIRPYFLYFDLQIVLIPFKSKKLRHAVGFISLVFINSIQSKKKGWGDKQKIHFKC